jgi:hypothetical protein
MQAVPVIDAFGATRVEWVYTKDPGFAEALKRGQRWFGGTLNANGSLTKDDGYARDFDGKVLVAPWMTGWNGRWVTTTHPDTQRDFEQQLARYIALGVRSIQHDDPRLQDYAAQNQGGDFNQSTIDGFPAWLASYSDRQVIKLAGLDRFNGDYRKWLISKYHVTDTADYIKRFRSFSSTTLWLEYVRSTVVAHFKRVRELAHDKEGHAIPISMNLSGLTEPIASNPFYFLVPYADYLIAEMKLGDWPQMVSAVATARSLGAGFEPSILPTSTEETRIAIASLYALGTQPVVPWDTYVGNDKSGKAQRFYGKPEDFADLYKFVRANPTLFDDLELAANVGVLVPVDSGKASQIREIVKTLVAHGIYFTFVPVGGGHAASAEQLRNLDAVVLAGAPDSFPAQTLATLTSNRVRQLTPDEVSSFDWSSVSPVTQAPPGSRVVLRASPRDPNRLVVHLVDPVSGVRDTVTKACTRKFAMSKSWLGNSSITSAHAFSPAGNPRTQIDVTDRDFVVTISGCEHWTVVELGLGR